MRSMSPRVRSAMCAAAFVLRIASSPLSDVCSCVRAPRRFESAQQCVQLHSCSALLRVRSVMCAAALKPGRCSGKQGSIQQTSRLQQINHKPEANQPVVLKHCRGITCLTSVAGTRMEGELGGWRCPRELPVVTASTASPCEMNSKKR